MEMMGWTTQAYRNKQGYVVLEGVTGTPMGLVQVGYMPPFEGWIALRDWARNIAEKADAQCGTVPEGVMKALEDADLSLE